jgi:hypothetical protein
MLVNVGHDTGKVPYCNAVLLVRFQVLTAASMKMTVFWDVAPCSLLEIDLK